MTGTPADRWQRLTDQIATETALPVTVNLRPYPGGVTRSIVHKLADGRVLEVVDTWWRKNDNVWTGYQVFLSDREGIIQRTSPKTKKRSDVIAAIQSALFVEA